MNIIRCIPCGTLRYADTPCEFGCTPEDAARFAQAHIAAMQPMIFALQAAIDIDQLIDEVEAL